jgi:plastocyanin
LLAGILVTVAGSCLFACPRGACGAPFTSATTATSEMVESPVQKDVYVIEIRDHVFTPAELIVPAGKKVKLRIENLDESAEEFESYALNREKIVAGGRKIIVFIGPLKPGRYEFFGDFNPKTAQGVIIAK